MGSRTRPGGGASTLFRHTLQTFMSMSGFMFINVFSAILLSRGLSPDDRGMYLGITMWNGLILGFCDVGIYITTVYLWSRSRDKDRKDVFATLLVWAIGTGAVCVGVVAIFADWMLKRHLSADEKLMAYLYFASSITGPLSSLFSGILAAEQRFSTINLLRVGVPAVLTACWLVYFTADSLSIAMCLATNSAISFLGLLPYLYQLRSNLRSGGSFRWRIFKQGFWYGLRGHGSSVVNVVGNSSSQLLIFALTPAALAYYQTASSALGILWALPAAIGVTSFPDLVKENPKMLHERTSRFIRLTALSTFLGGILLGLAEPVLIPLLFGKAYLASVLPGIILLPSVLFSGLSSILGGALNSTGRTLHNTVADAANVGATLLSMVLVLSAWSISGAAFSVLMGAVMSFAVRFIWYGRCIRRLKPIDFVPNLDDLRELARSTMVILRKLKPLRKSDLSAKGGILP
ncbi:lipopolysaccharide biosynthesis protein [Cohnella sp. AR92]|uniref:lipopolysaccharide biosynthesis protein n=1 Tax=Cohnella sp. AR92 TaxID=648716 RepID=UPI0013158CD4|nr:oligosaccharide flippase family protein [Cohnella sp. AR92]